MQSVNCFHVWRLLVRIDRLTEAYHALRRSHNNYERIFRHGRERYEYAGNELCIRSKPAPLRARPEPPRGRLRA